LVRPTEVRKKRNDSRRCATYRRGMNTAIHYGIFKSSLGRVLIASTSKGVRSILIGDAAAPLERDLQRRFPDVELKRDDARLAREFAQVGAFLATPHRALDLTLDLEGTAFQRRVWRALRAIPAGTTASYADIARRIAAPKSFRAVAQACGANPVALAIPCHRVVRNDGALSGYRWGVARKRALLAMESRMSTGGARA
jgi:AraC family transcriptional regulator, regulatory protein of adaptative response / methylated-DNA-[protein]-cysteine methyltransferase